MNTLVEKVREMTREEWMERRAEVRRQQNPLAMERSQRIRDEKSRHNQTLKEAYDLHALKLENIEAAYRERKQQLADEMDALANLWQKPEEQEGGAV